MRTLRLGFAAAVSPEWKSGDRFASNWSKKRDPGEWWFATVKSVSGKKAQVSYDTGDYDAEYTLAYLNSAHVIKLPPKHPKSKKQFTLDQVQKLTAGEAAKPKVGESTRLS